MLEIWTSLGIWIKCLNNFSPPKFHNIKRHDNLTEDPNMFFYVFAEISYERWMKMKEGEKWDPLNEEEKQGIQKLWNILDKIPGVRPLQMAFLHGGCSSYGKNGADFESGWDRSTNIDPTQDSIKLKPYV